MSRKAPRQSVFVERREMLKSLLFPVCSSGERRYEFSNLYWDFLKFILSYTNPFTVTSLKQPFSSKIPDPLVEDPGR